jgi:hypothetical protein
MPDASTMSQAHQRADWMPNAAQVTTFPHRVHKSELAINTNNDLEQGQKPLAPRCRQTRFHLVTSKCPSRRAASQNQSVYKDFYFTPLVLSVPLRLTLHLLHYNTIPTPNPSLVSALPPDSAGTLPTSVPYLVSHLHCLHHPPRRRSQVTRTRRPSHHDDISTGPAILRGKIGWESYTSVVTHGLEQLIGRKR